ncbi:hypothetical protein HEMA109418_08350 [Helcobacillus massiliensis]
MPKLPALRHRRNDTSEAVPVVLRHVVITVDTTGTLAVAVDQRPHLPPAGEVWGRGDFAAILDDLTEHRCVPVRVDVYESDGSHFTDIIHAHRPRRTPEPEPDTRPLLVQKLPLMALNLRKRLGQWNRSGWWGFCPVKRCSSPRSARKWRLMRTAPSPHPTLPWVRWWWLGGPLGP